VTLLPADCFFFCASIYPFFYAEDLMKFEKINEEKKVVGIATRGPLSNMLISKDKEREI
jgi:hypothetical protein